MFFAFSDQAECKSTIHWLCDYVSYQANKKATHHSRDLHSMIVAAFSCLQTWITSHPWLLESQVCISLRGRRLKGKGEGVLGARETREARFPRAQNPLSKTPFSLPFQTPATQARSV